MEMRGWNSRKQDYFTPNAPAKDFAQRLHHAGPNDLRRLLWTTIEAITDGVQPQGIVKGANAGGSTHNVETIYRLFLPVVPWKRFDI